MIGLATSILAARLLGPAGRGELAAIQTWPAIVATVAILGLPEAVVYFAARQPHRAGSYLGSAMALALLSSVPFIGLGYLLMPLVLAAQAPETIQAARWYLGIVPLFASVGMLGNALRGRNDFAAWNLIRVAPNLSWLIILLGALAVGGAEARPLAAAYLATLALLFLPLGGVVRRRVPGPFRPEVGEWVPMLRYGVPSVASTAPQVLNQRLDQLVLVALVPPHLLGLYVVAVGWSVTVSPLLSAVGAVLFPQVAAQHGPADQMRVLAQGGRLGVLISVAMVLAMITLTPTALPLVYGLAFADAIPVALVLVVATAISGINQILEDGLRGLGRPAAVMAAEAAGLGVTGAALILLLPPLGLIGAGLASVAGRGSVTLLLLLHLRRRYGCSLAELVPSSDDFSLVIRGIRLRQTAGRSTLG
jgi:O-antigen/teichoic acid export membrane protein